MSDFILRFSRIATKDQFIVSNTYMITIYQYVLRTAGQFLTVYRDDVGTALIGDHIVIVFMSEQRVVPRSGCICVEENVV